ncbi:hypothetical protein M011DRAFT_474060 [Sporormia fimetaria CBS 119925]|uniref:Uncharacterized protein n=1 Tax=Sporormia fimetaria CBS 119925 TaxID=1340428 RepID=A0A6A6VPR9_9PLEO|nr:hypothetical protein M011DRAFT_474060 [Sporormia fimetaria CBS 119925]
MGVWDKINEVRSPNQPPAKRISTPAGHRLSVVLGNDAQKQKRSSFRKSLGVTIGEEPEESDRSQKSSGYSYSVWSDGEKFAIFRNTTQVTQRVGWRKIILALAILIAGIIALAVGLTVGLKKTPNDANAPQSQDPLGAETTDRPDPSNTKEPAPTDALPPPSAAPSGFPVGSYSMVTYLDTIQTNCTSNPATWTCHPSTIYNEDTVAAVASFDWVITSPTEGKYQISSSGDNPYSINFKGAELKLQAEGKDSEHFRFQVSHTKTVTPLEPLSEGEDAEVECDFTSTFLQAFLYTKRVRTYPNEDKGEGEGDAKSPAWPYAVRIEQSIAGGPDTPKCRKVSDKLPLKEKFATDDPSGSCSCLYRNANTPSPYGDAFS